MTASGRPIAKRAAALLCGAAAAFALLAAAPAASAAAAQTAGVATPGASPVHPGPHGYFEYSLAPGVTTTGTLVVANHSKESATYDLYPADATTSPTTGVGYGQPSSATTGTAAWLHLSQRSVTLALGSSTTVSVTVTVPHGATPGQHVAAVSAQAPSASPAANTSTGAGSSVSFVTTTRVVVAVVVDVPGPAAVGLTLGKPKVTAPQHVRQLLSVPIASTGGLLTKPVLAGIVRPCGSSGTQTIDAVHRQLGTFVPHTVIDYPWTLGQPLATGCYSVALSLTATGVTKARFTGDVRVGKGQVVAGLPAPHPLGVPLPLAAVDLVALILVLAAFGYVLRRGRRRRALHRRQRARHAPPARSLGRAA